MLPGPGAVRAVGTGPAGPCPARDTARGWEQLGGSPLHPRSSCTLTASWLCSQKNHPSAPGCSRKPSPAFPQTHAPPGKHSTFWMGAQGQRVAMPWAPGF